MARKRALGVIRKSNKPGEASTSLPRQREIIEQFCESQDYDLVGVAEDVAKSAFHIPPEKRKAIAAWLDRPEDFDLIVYWRQDRLVRQPWDFMGLVQYAQTNGKALYSATEGTGDVSKGAGVLVGFINAWQAQQESVSTGARVKDIRAGWEPGRWGGGRPPYGFKAVMKAPGDKSEGWILVPDEKGTARVVTEAAHRVIAGESVHAVIADFNIRGVKSADGGLWKQWVLSKILHNPALMDSILTPAEFGQLQMALDARASNRTVRTTGHDSILLDIVFCGRCGGKIYRWKRDHIVWGRCRNRALRYQSATPCNLPQAHYDFLEAAVREDVIGKHGDDLIEERVTDASRQLRIDEIERALIRLPGELADKWVTRAEFTERQTALLDERDELASSEGEPEWKSTGETVRERWEGLSDAERRLWLLRIGTTYTADCKTKTVVGKKSKYWEVIPSWRPRDDDASYRERVTRP